jgi:hypothetical protein
LSSVLDHLYQTLVQHFLKEVPQERDVNKDAEVVSFPHKTAILPEVHMWTNQLL